jgi:hypothetical protein
VCKYFCHNRFLHVLCVRRFWRLKIWKFHSAIVGNIVYYSANFDLIMSTWHSELIHTAVPLNQEKRSKDLEINQSLILVILSLSLVHRWCGCTIVVANTRENPKWAAFGSRKGIHVQGMREGSSQCNHSQEACSWSASRADRTFLVQCLPQMLPYKE